MSGLRVEGLRQTIRNLEKLGVEAQDLKTAMNRVGTKVAGDARGEAPVLSGLLASTIRANKAKSKIVISVGGARIPYAHVIHWGWPGHNIESNPFLVRAVSKNEEYMAEQVEKELDALIRRLDLN